MLSLRQRELTLTYIARSVHDLVQRQNADSPLYLFFASGHNALTGACQVNSLTSDYFVNDTFHKFTSFAGGTPHGECGGAGGEASCVSP